jgi:hypothetical protein
LVQLFSFVDYGENCIPSCPSLPKLYYLFVLGYFAFGLPSTPTPALRLGLTCLNFTIFFQAVLLGICIALAKTLSMLALFSTFLAGHATLSIDLER